MHFPSTLNKKAKINSEGKKMDIEPENKNLLEDAGKSELSNDAGKTEFIIKLVATMASSVCASCLRTLLEFVWR